MIIQIFHALRVVFTSRVACKGRKILKFSFTRWNNDVTGFNLLLCFNLAKYYLEINS